MRALALVTHSTRPRGGFVHTLGLAEALHRKGVDVHLIALGDPDAGLLRPTQVPHTVLAGPSKAGTTLQERVFAAIDALEAGLGGPAARFDVLHAQDCIAARAAARVRDAGAPVSVVRTVHHVDDFTTQALIDCQRAAIAEPDHVFVVSEQWRAILRNEYGRDAAVVPNGVDPDRFPPPSPGYRAALRARVPAGRFLFLGVGGVEPRKGTVHAFRALARLRRELGPVATLAIVGGHSFQDYTAYRDAALASLPGLGLVLGEDVVLLGTVDEAELAGWYHTADALCFPSVKEGWGLVVLEAMSTGLPVIASDLPVFGEYLVDGESALLPRVGDDSALAAAMRRLIADPDLRERLVAGGHAVLPRYTWEASAARHQELYAWLRTGTRV
ncbi:MSMEG_0565 family glycosyltransferase [Pseudonocardia asaccharolytica]|uniref:Glycosyl transferase family 1 n=1 Tax=Pseudonocardia asaccharolytica DSM 44247 = NBRC 16224 TaxID=1123024 RepID=A0A511D832_9PSEU|nr:MSMEG_0565 family glycosyltransferase [Pseudonocardia asaccharolytica]GEL20936.1 glycosyl transferase family 1 [Pseudonocardia asaccharolytica DSM 44247 = NBRC 16224]